MKKIFVFITLLLFSNSFASDEAGSIKELKGRVQLFDGTSPRAVKVKEADTPIFLKNRIVTKRNAAAVIDLISGDRIALDSSSEMVINEINRLSAKSGRVIFHINKRGRASGLQVATKNAVIGVKGTKFMLDWRSEDGYGIYLKEGKVECLPTQGQFKMYKEVVIDEYEAYVKKMAGEYEDYIKKLEEDYIEFVDSFEMKPGDAYSVIGNEVRKLDFDDDVENSFKLLDDVTTKTSEPHSLHKSDEDTYDNHHGISEAEKGDDHSLIKPGSQPQADKDTEEDDGFDLKDDLDEEVDSF